MPWSYTGTVEGITPATNDDNWTLDFVSAGVGMVKEIYWGGETTSSTAMRTRVARSNGEAGAQTGGNTAKPDGANTPSAQIDFVTTYASTQPTLEAGSLFAMGWNAHGGMIRWQKNMRDGFFMITGETLDLISCRNGTGTGQSTYGVEWEEWSQ